MFQPDSKGLNIDISIFQLSCDCNVSCSAICPYLALETCRQWRMSPKTVAFIKNGKLPSITVEQTQKNFKKAVKAGLLKILSKMGISLLTRYEFSSECHVFNACNDSSSSCINLYALCYHRLLILKCPAYCFIAVTMAPRSLRFTVWVKMW